MFEDLSPVDIGLPAHFSAWRQIQEEAAEFAIYNPKRFTVMNLPTGAGKSLAVMTIAKILQVRTIVLTATKGLADQYVSDFGTAPPHVLNRLGVPPEPNGFIDIRGKNNYPCVDPGLNFDVQCSDGQRIGCKWAGTSKCTSTAALTAARDAPIVVTNYKYWMHVNQGTSNGLTRILSPNPPQLLVLDEAHLAPDQLSSFLAVRMYEKEIVDHLHASAVSSELIKDWRQFAVEWKPTAKAELDERTKKLKKQRQSLSKSEMDHLARLEGLVDKLDKLAAMSNSGWVCEQREGTRAGRVWDFDPIWPGQEGERRLFLGVPKVVLVSANNTPKTMGLLGVRGDEYKYKEWKRIFPAYRCPVYHLPSARIRYNSSTDDYKKWIARIDQIIESRLGRKGIIHTVSYDRQAYILQHSRFAKYMIGNDNDPDSPTAAQIVSRFRKASAPCILISPSFSTGWDFPGPDCEWQIISKVPFPSAQSKVMRERKERDPQYISHVAMRELVQACGRGMRFPDDRCETFIVDDSIGWFMATSSGLKPSWFSVKKMATLPPLPPPLSPEAVERAISKLVADRLMGVSQ